MKTLSSSLAYSFAIVFVTVWATVSDAATHMFFVQPSPDFWSRFAFVAPGDFMGFGLVLFITLPVYALLFWRFYDEKNLNYSGAFLLGLGIGVLACSLSGYVLYDASSAIVGPRPIWVHIANLPGGVIWLPCTITVIVLLIIRLLISLFRSKSI